MIWAVGKGPRVQKKRSKCSGIYADIHVKYTDKQNNSENNNNNKHEDSTNNDNSTTHENMCVFRLAYDTKIQESSGECIHTI